MKIRIKIKGKVWKRRKNIKRKRRTMDRWIELWPDGIFLGVFLAMGLARCGVVHGRAIAVLLPDRRR